MLFRQNLPLNLNPIRAPTTVSEAQPVELGFLPYARQPSKNVPFRSTEKLKARRHRDNGAAILRLIRSSQNCCYNVVIKETYIYT